MGQCLGRLGTALMLIALGAHFYRAGDEGMVLGAAGMLLFRGGSAAWKRHAVALFLSWGALERALSAQTPALTRMRFVGIVTVLHVLFLNAARA